MGPHHHHGWTFCTNGLHICCVGSNLLSGPPPPPFKSISCAFAVWGPICCMGPYHHHATKLAVFCFMTSIGSVGNLFVLNWLHSDMWPQCAAWDPTTIQINWLCSAAWGQLAAWVTFLHWWITPSPTNVNCNTQKASEHKMSYFQPIESVPTTNLKSAKKSSKNWWRGNFKHLR